MSIIAILGRSLKSDLNSAIGVSLWIFSIVKVALLLTMFEISLANI